MRSHNTFDTFTRIGGKLAVTLRLDHGKIGAGQYIYTHIYRRDYMAAIAGLCDKITRRDITRAYI